MGLVAAAHGVVVQRPELAEDGLPKLDFGLRVGDFGDGAAHSVLLRDIRDEVPPLPILGV